MTGPAYGEHSLLVMGGTLKSPVGSAVAYTEEWQCTLRGHLFSNTNGVQVPIVADDGASHDAALENIGPKLLYWYQHQCHSRNDATLDYVKLNGIGTDGRYADRHNSHEWTAPANSVGQYASGMPSFLSVCISFTTNRRRGRGSRGRMYFPFAIDGGAGSTITSAAATAFKDDGVTLLRTLRNFPFQGNPVYGDAPFVFDPWVISRLGPADEALITGVRVGNVIDVQRRRKNQIPETYVASAPNGADSLWGG